MPSGDRRTAAAGPVGPAPLGGPCAAAASGRRTGGRRVCLRCGGIECETGGVRCLYGRTVRPGWGNRTPVGSNPAVFETAVIPFRQIRRRWRLLPPLDRRVLRHQVKNGGNLLPGNRGGRAGMSVCRPGAFVDPDEWPAAFGAGWPGMVPPVGGTVPPGDRPARRRGEAWQGPVGALQRTPGGVLFWPADRQAGWHPAGLLPGRHVYGK